MWGLTISALQKFTRVMYIDSKFTKLKSRATSKV